MAADKQELESLLASLRTGNQQALPLVLAKIRPYLHLLVHQMAAPNWRNRLGDSDIVQEALLRISGGLQAGAPAAGCGFRGHNLTEFLAWINQIARHVIIDLERRGIAKKRDVRREMTGASVLANLAGEPSPEQGLEQAERAVQVAAALDRLPAHQRHVLELRIFEQLSYKEISDQLGKSEGALRVLVTRALGLLRADEQLRQLMEADS